MSSPSPSRYRGGGGEVGNDRSGGNSNSDRIDVSSQKTDNVANICHEDDDDAAAAAAAGAGDKDSVVVIQPWSISVKTVGGGFGDGSTFVSSTSGDGQRDNTYHGGERLFNVTVSPEDGLDALHEVIEGATGVKPSQQRLIYRGRLIEEPSSSSLVDSTVEQERQHQEQRHNQQPSGTRRKIKDIAGLCDGQTIHLVKKRDLTSSSSASASAAAAAAGDRENQQQSPSSLSTSNRPRQTTLVDSLGGTGDENRGGSGGALLAALLGLGSLVEESNNSNNFDPIGHVGDPSATATDGFITGLQTARLVAPDGERTTTTTTTTTSTTASPSSPTIARTRRTAPASTATTSTALPASGGESSLLGRTHRRPHYRFSMDDLHVPDPGSMESVRQGMMTLHTLLPHSQLHSEEGTSPLQANREWFRGQWCDVRDTVNQWLEATIVEILLPQEVLPEASPSYTLFDVRRPPRVDADPAVHANDLEGRRRLLIEACEPGDPNELGADLVGFRPRQTNHGVQLLLVHYNGWPHRWDEWIRSDSERIRPFRTRTRHPNSSAHVSPTPQSIFSEAPRTHICSSDDEEDRDALLPELYRVMSQVTNLLGEMVDRQRVSDTVDQRHRRVEANLPWLDRSNGGGTAGTTLDIDENDGGLMDFPPRNLVEACDTDDDEDDDVDDDAAASAFFADLSSSPRRRLPTQRAMRNLATMLDRLGRTLTDAAPHVAAVAASIPDPTISASLPQETNGSSHTTNTTSYQDQSHTPLGGILSLWSSSRERRRQINTGGVGSLNSLQSVSIVDPDHIDYANGLVNTTRGDVRSGPRNRSASDDLAALLGSYLAAASLQSLANGDSDGGILGPLFRSSTTTNGGVTAGRGEGGELAIHIQAVFTSPGNTGGTGMMTLGTGGGDAAQISTAPFGGTRSLFSSVRNGRSSLLRSRSNQISANSAVDDDDDDSLFSELYSANPAPIDPNTSNNPTPSPSPRSDEGNRSSFVNDSTPNSTDPSIHNSIPRRRSSLYQSRRPSSERRGPGLLRIFRRRGQNDGS